MIGPLFTLVMTEARRIWCFRWLVAVVTVAVWVCSGVYIQRLPDTYDAWGQIYVDQQTPLVAAAQGVSLVSSGYGSPYVIQTILLNDDNLEKVVLRMDPAAASKGKVAMAGAVNRLRRQIRRAPDPGDGFIELHVTDRDPVRARNIVQLLIDQFISANTDRNTRDLARAGQFLDQQIASYSSMLSASQAKMEEFRRAHPVVANSALPQGPFYAVSAGPPSASQAPAIAAAAPTPAPLVQANARVAELETRLAALRAIDTEEHPDVVATRRQLGDAIQARNIVERSVPTSAVSSTAPAYRSVAARERFPQAPPPAPPEVAAAWADLQRSDEMLRANYQELMAKQAATRMSQAVYSADQAGKYQIVRQPTVPVFPAGPNRMMYLAFAGVMSLGAGLAAGFLRASIKGVLVSTQEVEQAFQLPVIGTVSWEPAWHVPRPSVRGRRISAFFRRSTRKSLAPSRKV